MTLAPPLLHPLLALGSSDPGVRLAGGRELVKLLAQPEHFRTFRSQGVLPLIFRGLAGLDREELGEVPQLAELRHNYLGALKTYTVQEREIRQLVEVLTAAGVEVILLKGADVRYRLYEDPATRVMGDVDVLLAPEQMTRACSALERQGYRLHAWDLDPQPGFNARFDYDLSYQPPSGAVPFVDLHWEIRQVGTLYRLPYGPLRARAQVLELKGLTALVLSPEHLVIHLGLHTFDELETAGLMKFVDLHRALTRLPLNWERFMAEAAAFGVQGPLHLLFRELERLYPGVVPQAVLTRLAAYRPHPAERLVLRRRPLSLSVAALLALWRYLPLRAWPAYLHGKLWPSTAYLRANPQEYGDRWGYLRHLWRRLRAPT